MTSTTITELSQLDLTKSYTYADYLEWNIEERLELINGKVYMLHYPMRLHQKTLINLLKKFHRTLNNDCEMYFAPFDVRFPDQNGNIKTVVQPDLCVICDQEKLDDRGCLGAPDLVVEILSPGNSKREMKYKFELYQENGVAEYWVVRPEEKNIQIFVLENGRYIGLAPITEGDIAASTRFPDLRFSTETLFD